MPIIQSPQFDVGRIEIIENGQGTWTLKISVACGIGIGADKVEIVLDRNMLAHSPKIGESYNQLIGTAGVTISRPRSGYKVSENYRVVEFPVDRSIIKRSTYVFDVIFEWKNEVLVPNSLDIVLRSFYAGFQRQEIVASGLHVGGSTSLRKKISRVLSRASDTYFLFSAKDVLAPRARMDYSEFSPIVAEVQQYPDTVVWGTTWPSEVAFWKGEHGKRFLAYQVFNKKYRDGKSSLRIAVCPYSLGLSNSECTEFVAELDIQRRCGVHIRIMDIDTLKGKLPDGAEAILSLGTSLGVVYHDLSGSIANKRDAITVSLAKQENEVSREMYIEFFNICMPFLKYCQSRAVYFETDVMAHILDRVIEIELLAERLRVNAAEL